MKLNHINLPVMDIAVSRDFFTRYFGMKTVMELRGNFLAVLHDDGGMVLNLSHFDKKATEIAYHKDFHIGFFLDSTAEVDAKHAEMVADGLDAPAPHRLQGRYGFYYRSPGGFDVEVAWLDDSEWKPSATSATVEANIVA